MSKIAIIYVSRHHGNTERLLSEAAAGMDIELIPLSILGERDLCVYEAVGLASGIYGFELDQELTGFALGGAALPKKLFVIYTSGMGRDSFGTSFIKKLEASGHEVLGHYQCKGFDTFGPFKLIGGLAKGHPDQADIEGCRSFLCGILSKSMAAAEKGGNQDEAEPQFKTGLQDETKPQAKTGTTKGKRINNVIFDVDGTLWDSSEIVASSWTRAIRENTDLDISYTAQFLKDRAFGRTMEEIGRVLLPDCTDEERKQLAKLCFEYEDRDILVEKAYIYEGVYESLKALRELGYELFIVSNCQKGYVEVCMDQCGITGLIKDHLCYGDTLAEKDVTIRQLMDKNSIDASEAIYVGDTAGDQNASKKAGIPFIHAAYGFGKAKAPEYVISDIRELPGLLEEINGGKR